MAYTMRIQHALPSSSTSLYLLSFFSLFCALRASELNNYEEELSTTSSLASNLRKAYTNEWAVRIAGGSEAEATRLAAKYGYLNLGRIIPGEEYFCFVTSISAVVRRGDHEVFS